MAFMLPLAIGGVGGIGGFIAGYMYNYPTDGEANTESETNSLDTPHHKGLNEELQKFQKNQLKKTALNSKQPFADDTLLDEMRKKILLRRQSLESP